MKLVTAYTVHQTMSNWW